MANRFVATSVFGLLLATGWLSMPTCVSAFDEHTHVFKSVEDPTVQADLSVCAQASFTPNAVLSASFYAVQGRSADGLIVNSSTKRIGWGTACARITSLAVGATVPIIGDFNINKNKHLIGEGACVLASNNVPAAGLILAGCTIPLDAGNGVLGGIATSNTVFNPFGLPGFDTGSVWTVHVFDQ